MGAAPTYTDIAIMSMVTLKSLCRLGGRQTSGLMASLFKLMQVEMPVPDHPSTSLRSHSTVSRRMGKLEVTLPIVNREQARHVVIDSAGIKGYGAGEWKVRHHGVSKRRTWRKLHLAVDESTGEMPIFLISAQKPVLKNC